jgi:hypothetical protein
MRSFVGADPLKAYNTDVSDGDEYWAECPLFVASEKGHVKIVSWLVSGPDPICPATIEKKDTKMTALHFAALYGHIDVLQTLLDCDIPAPLETGFGAFQFHFRFASAADLVAQIDGSALHYAAVRGRIDAARFLIARYALVGLAARD